MPFTATQKQTVLQNLFVGKYLALCGSSTGTGEPSTSGTGYSRFAASAAAAGGSFTVTSSGTSRTVKNNAKIKWNEASNAAGWGTLTHLCIYSAATGGNLLFDIPFTNSITINQDDMPKFEAEAISVTYQ